MNTVAPAPRQNLRIPLLLALLFFGPLIAATLLYTFGGPAFRPTGSVAHGELLAEPPTLPDGDFVARDGTRFALRHTWSLIEVTAGDCAADCQAALYRTRQVRRALGREMSRVQRLLVPRGTLPPADWLAREHPGVLVVDQGTPARAVLDAALGSAAPGAVFIADPLGNVILRFPAGTAMKDMHKDLALLLKASRIG
jgi:hypothetical protein